MKILQILPELNVGGVETGTVDLAKYLIEHGHHSVVVSNGGALVGDLEIGGSTHYKLPVHKKSLWTIVHCIKKLRLIIQKEDIDVVHARSRVPAWIAFFACRKTKAAFITTCHGYYSKHPLSRVMGWAKYVIVPSEVIGRHMIDDFGVSPESIRRIPRSVDLQRYNVSRSKKSDPSFIVTMIGRITPLKGHAYFLRAMAKVIRTLPYLRIWIVGDAPKKKESYRQELEVLTRRLGLADYVEFLGNRRDVPHLLSKTDALVLSTITQEAFGRVILEAQACDVPVVATKVGGVVEIIDDQKTGLLVLPKDTDAMAQAIIKILKDKNLASQLVLQARKKLEENFTLELMASRTVAVYEELIATVNILVLKISSIGDVVLITPSLKALREKYPKAKIHCLVGKQARKALSHCPYIDGVIVFDPQDKDKGWFRTFHFSRKLRKQKFDIVVDLQNNRISHLLGFLSLAKERLGYNNGKWSFLLTAKAPKPLSPMSPVQHQFQVLKMLGIPYDREAKLELWPSENDKQYVQNLLEAEWLGTSHNIVGINLAASAKWETKNWPIEYVAQVCDHLANQNIRVAITGLEKDRPAFENLLKMTKTKPANFVGKTDILQLAALIERCKVYITPDSAPMHLSAAMRTPFIAFFGPTSSSRHAPPSTNCKVIEKKPDCAPCYSPQCRIQTHVCMRDITPEEVTSYIKELMTVSV